MAPRGASALRGGYDVGIIMERKQGEREAVLHMESRDVDPSSLTIRQAVNGAGWECLGSGGEIEKIRAGRAVVEGLRLHGDGLTAEELAELLDKSKQTIHKQLKLAERDGLVTRQKGERFSGGRPTNVWFLKEGINI